MDPISVAASVLTVLGAAGTAGRALEHVSQLRNAPDHLVTLVNEVSDLRVVLYNARQAMECRKETVQDCGSLARIVHRAGQAVSELNTLIEHQLIKGDAVDSDGKPRPSRTAFFRYGAKIRTLKAELQDVKLSLLIAVGTLTFADMSNLKVDLQNLDVLDNRPGRETICGPEEATEAPQQALYGTPDVERGGTGRPSSDELVPTTRPLRFDTLEALGSAQPGAVPPIPMSAWKCHKVTKVATSNLCKPVLGRLFIGYVGLPLLSHRKCNRVTCQNRYSAKDIRIKIAYLFPLWFALRLWALTIWKSSTTFKLKLDFPVVTQTAAPVYVASSLGATQELQSLLSSNTAMLNAVDATANKSPLQVALQFRQVTVVSMLLHQGAEMHVQDCNNKTPLDTYYENYFTAKEEDRMSELLPIFEAYDVFDYWNSSYIHLIVLGCVNMDLTTYLAITNEPIDVQDSWGRTALMWAAWRGDTESVSILLSFGANPQATSYDGNSVLIYATYGGSIDCMGLLLGTGADINHTSHAVVTPAMGGSRLGDNKAIAKVRCERGAAIEALRQQHFTPLYAAALSNNADTLRFLLDCGASVDVDGWNCSTPLSMAISFNNHAMAEELINRGANLDQACPFTVSYLRSAAVFGDEKMMRLITNARPAIDVSLKDSQGCTARDRMQQRVQIMGAKNPAAERLEKTFRELEEVCEDELERAKMRAREEVEEEDQEKEKGKEKDADGEDVEVFYDARDGSDIYEPRAWGSWVGEKVRMATVGVH